MFREIKAQTVERYGKICGLIREIATETAEFFSTEIDELMTNIINENKHLETMMAVVQRLQTAA
ncbi:MAG: hypothetical protein HUK14_03985 [Muribaculaceae bacterium]|nr:hypothetical protein [Muribaculaceae bacterium]